MYAHAELAQQVEESERRVRQLQEAVSNTSLAVLRFPVAHGDVMRIDLHSSQQAEWAVAARDSSRASKRTRLRLPLPHAL